MTSDDNAASVLAADLAKRHFIEAFFDDFEERRRFVDTLLQQGHDIEATILCCAYIEGIANNLFPESTDSARNFSRVLAEHGADPFLTAIHPRFLLDALPRKRAADRQCVAALKPLLADSVPLCQPQDILSSLSESVSTEAREVIQANLWRGSIANLAYVHIRSAMFKRGMGSPSISFSGQSFEGGPAPNLTTQRLCGALRSVLRSARDISFETNKWYRNIG